MDFLAERLNLLSMTQLSLIKEQSRRSQLVRDFEPWVPAVPKSGVFFDLDSLKQSFAGFDAFSF